MTAKERFSGRVSCGMFEVKVGWDFSFRISSNYDEAVMSSPYGSRPNE